MKLPKKKKQNPVEKPLENLIQCLDNVSEQGIRRILYDIVKYYPFQCSIIINNILCNSKKPL